MKTFIIIMIVLLVLEFFGSLYLIYNNKYPQIKTVDNAIIDNFLRLILIIYALFLI